MYLCYYLLLLVCIGICTLSMFYIFIWIYVYGIRHPIYVCDMWSAFVVWV